MDGQIRFDGREVAEVRTKWGDLELHSLPEGLSRDELGHLSPGDLIGCTTWYVVEHVDHSEKFDRHGIGTKPFTRALRLKTLKKWFHVDKVIKRADREETWREEHGATA